MPDAALSPELQRFIARHIESVEKLEILLLFFREPTKSWRPTEIFQQIQSSPASVDQKIAELVADGFVVRQKDGTFQFQAKSQPQVAALDDAYRLRRIKVIESIFSQATEELRDFSNAFKIRKETE
jgi:DNA-binding IclR family transcriptional regulator